MMAEGNNKLGNVVQACDLCRLKKRKCDLKAGVRRCSGCEKTDSVCQITHVTKPREKRKKKQMENLEDRLRSLEDLIRSSVAEKASKSPTQERPEAMTPSSLPSTAASTERISWTSESILADTDAPANKILFQTPLCVAGSGSDQVPETPSDILQSLAGDFWLPGNTPSWTSRTSSHFDMPNAGLNPVDIDLRPQTRTNGPRKCSLPPVQGGLFLLQEFLVDFNTAMPLFDSTTITAQFLDCYNGKGDGSVISWVALKVVLAIAHRLRAMSPLGVTQDTENVQLYLEESLAELPQLLLMSPTLLLAQCLIGMAIVISTSSRPQPAALLVTMALRVLQDLHVNDPPPQQPVPSEPDALQRQRVFWMAYTLDTDMSLRAGRTPSLSSRLINVPLPAVHTPDSAGEIKASDGDFTINVFLLRIQLALLQAELMEHSLASRAPAEQGYTDDQSLQVIMAKLDDWRQNRLFRLSAENLRNMLHRSDLVHVLVLESTYLATAYSVRARLCSAAPAQAKLFSVEGLVAVTSGEVCQALYRDSRRFVDLLQLVPGDNLSCNWPTVAALVSALVVILAHVPFDARYHNGQSDIIAARPVLQVLHQLGDYRSDDELTGIQSLCDDLYLRAESALQAQAVSRQ